MPAAPRRRPRQGATAPVVFLVAAFAASRLVYRLAGVRFDASTLPTFVQFVDPELLRHHLASRIWYLHTQPPLYNLYLGVLLKAAGGSFTGVAHATSLVAGLALAVAIYALLRRLGVGAWWAAGASFLF